MTFLFTTDHIMVYTDKTNFQYKFRRTFELNQIKFLQIWNDLERIDELSFVYKSEKLPSMCFT